MKLKGISFIEQHVEKIVLGVAAAIALALLLLQFNLLGDPNAVDVGGTTYAPNQVAPAVDRLAATKRGQLQGEFAPGEGPPEVADIGSARGGLPDALVADANNILRTGADTAGEEPTIGPEQPRPGAGLAIVYPVPEPPAPSGVVASVHGSTIDPLVAMRFEEVAALLPEQQPYDAVAVSVQSSFDAPRWQEVLAARPEGENAYAIPSQWRQQVELVDVVLERREVLADGSFGEVTTLDPLPGTFSLRETLLDENTTGVQRAQIVRQESDNRLAIRRPGYWPSIAGRPWVRPAAAVELAEGVDGTGDALSDECALLQRRVTNQRRRITQIARDIERIEEEIENLGGRGGRGGGEGRDGGRGGGGAGGMGGGGRSDAGDLPGSDDAIAAMPWPTIDDRVVAQMRGGGGDQSPDTTPEERRRERLQETLESKEIALQSAQETLDELCAELLEVCGIDCDAQEQDEDTGPELPEPLDEPLLSVTEMEQPVTIWAHDATARRGRTYQYRMTVRLVNPFFGNAAQLDESQKELATQPTLLSAPSAWTDRIEVWPETVLQVVAANEGGNRLGTYRAAEATVEAYRFYYGYWRRVRATLSPGDLVIASADLPDGLPRFELATSEEQEGGSPEVTGSEPLEGALEVVTDLMLVAVSGAGDAFEAMFASVEGEVDLRAGESSTFLDVVAASALAAETAPEVRAPGGMGPRRGGDRGPRGPAGDDRDRDPRSRPGGAAPGGGMARPGAQG